ncbi:MAG: 1-(5-phosphoribosyl)-5-[(5-phosphoribosylamino)methylideneamino]imidazole-4-carboxamide isomerase [Planctomycetales bacterium]|nr:1-(5-phosphoribosyl)-5-[(5-phosphoribosylamino)methylideneamino]imidazole-4-carboxamide isomerase [Planctomycetales bacterium]MBN8625342.1 1-(5-phosphoribosyl)-5-[(5-phosphoribosylamino)methylideneamino]imidazole-4-carboxamide isomerase [Planctomycetota bacterium]
MTKTSALEVWPAIDLRGGQCVRLQQGDYNRETVFNNDPVAVARQFVADGGEYLHLVDLDGARDGKLVNLEVVRAITAAVEIPCELGGGVRTEDDIRTLLGAGLSRVVVGTKALREPEWFREMCHKFPNKIALGIDARNGMVATHGWLETSDVSAVAMARQFADEPIAALIYTDIATDGMLQGPNLAAMREMAEAVSLPVIASGGVSSAQDVSKLTDTGVAGCIIGRALYEGHLTLKNALAAARGQPVT